MADGENVQPATKKRAALKQISRDDDFDAEDENTSGQEIGTFQRASEEVLAKRRIVKVKRNTSVPSSEGTANPFASIRLVATPTSQENISKPAEDHPSLPSVQSSESPDGDSNGNKSGGEANQTHEVDVKTTDESEKVDEVVATENKDTNVPSNENEEEKEDKTTEEKQEALGENKSTVEDAKQEISENLSKDKENEPEKTSVESSRTEDAQKEASGSFSSFKQLSSTPNAFAGVSGTGFGSSSSSFGFLSNSGNSTSTVSFGASFSSGSSGSNGFPALNFNSVGASDSSLNKGPALHTFKEVPVETGEEKEKALFNADAVLYEFISGSWKERGKGEIKVNVSTSELSKARLVMRSKGNYRLILNASLFPDMKLSAMDKKGVSFLCINSAGEANPNSLATFALRFKEISMVDEFKKVVDEHKDGKPSTNPKTPENSPKPADE